jgi:hypothetical protein
MLLVNVVAALVMLGMCTLLVLDSRPARGVLFVLARWQHRRRVGQSSPGSHEHLTSQTSH